MTRLFEIAWQIKILSKGSLWYSGKRELKIFSLQALWGAPSANEEQGDGFPPQDSSFCREEWFPLPPIHSGSAKDASLLHGHSALSQQLNTKPCSESSQESFVTDDM